MTKKILAIDDENDVLVIIKSALKSEGYDVVTANNGYDGLAIAQDEKPDLILLDLMMPEMDGFEVLENLRDNDTTMDIPVIVLTGLSERGKIREALDKGVDYYIVKPFEYHDLISKVKLAIEDAEEQEE
jgi:DNA-binding response OmpR family regulator